MKPFLRLFSVLLLLAAVLVFVFFGLNSSLYELGFLKAESAEPVILELVHIETFEGGSASRAGYLQKMARDFNKKHPGKFVNIKAMTAEQFELNADYVPDLVSFGIGAGDIIKDRLSIIELNFNVRADLIDYGKFEDELLAVPYMLGGYAVISRNDYAVKTGSDNIFEQGFDLGKRRILGAGMGMQGPVNPAQALVFNGFEGSGQYISGSTYEVYEQFLKGSFCNLAGTQRDVYRIKNREELGSFAACQYNFLGGFSDLVQYVGLLKQNTTAEEFVKFLLSDEAQKALSGIGMFSVNTGIYADGYMRDFETALSQTLTSLNVFMSDSEIEQKKQQSIAHLGITAYNG